MRGTYFRRVETIKSPRVRYNNKLQQSKQTIMKQRYISFTMHLILAVFVCVSFIGINSCGDDSLDSEEDSIDEVLSIDTTPVSFIYDELTFHSDGLLYLFDYTPGGQLVSTSTFEVRAVRDGKITVNLRRGKHKLLWMTGICNNAPDGYDYWTGDRHGTHFDPATKELFWYDDYSSSGSVVYYREQNITVTDHVSSIPLNQFLPTTCSLRVLSKDIVPAVGLSTGDGFEKEIGTLKIGKRVKTMSLTGKHYTLIDSAAYGVVYARAVIENSKPIDTCVVAFSPSLLCPVGGLSNIPITCEVKDKNGDIVPTTAFPNQTLKRGYVTSLEGFLFSGKPSGWRVTQ
jgi:hypothetical protein